MEIDELKNLNSNGIAEKLLRRELNLCEKPGRGKIWSIFNKIKNREGIIIHEYVYCKTCQKVLRYNKKSRSNLVKHKCYINCEVNENSIFEEDKPITAVENPVNKGVSIFEEEKTIIESVKTPTNNVTRLLTKWIIKDCRPYNMVQNKNLLAIFQEIASLGSEFGGDLDIYRLLSSAPVIEKNISAIYENCFEKVKAEIASIKENGFGLTTDIWTDSLAKQSYITVTIHYLINGALKFRLLGLQTFEGTNILEKVEEILADFDCKLSSKSIIVTDEDIFKSVADTKNIPCISHLLDSALRTSVKEVPEVAEIISSCSKLVDYLNKIGLSSIFDDLLHNFYPNRGILMYKMLSSVETNWNEIVNALESRNESEQLSAVNIHHLRAVKKTFQPFEDAIETLEDDSSANLHLVLVYLHDLKKSCDTNDNEFRDFDFIESLKENLNYKLELIVTENITTVHKLALFLYPPTNKLLQFSDDEKKSVDEECIRLMKCYKNETKTSVKQEPELLTPVSKRRKLFSDFVVTEANHDPNELITREIQYYKNTHVVNSADFDQFTWWELQKNNFPLLYKLSCTVLATPATCAASKRAFVAARSLLCKKSFEGTKEMQAGKIMFINSNSENDELDSNLLVQISHI